MAPSRDQLAVTQCGHKVADLDKLATLVRDAGGRPRAGALPKGVDYIGAGVSKATVGICARHVLKVQKNGWNQAIAEIAFWEGASENLREFLAPIEAHDATGSWIVSARCVPLGQYGDREGIERQVKLAMKALVGAGINDIGSADFPRGDNIGVYAPNGGAVRVMCLDYGIAGAGGWDRQEFREGATVPRGGRFGPGRCHTNKPIAACLCDRCKGLGGGFHKGMGKGQRRVTAVRMVAMEFRMANAAAICWTGQPLERCHCAKCAINANLRPSQWGKRRLVGGHGRERATNRGLENALQAAEMDARRAAQAADQAKARKAAAKRPKADNPDSSPVISDRDRDGCFGRPDLHAAWCDACQRCHACQN